MPSGAAGARAALLLLLLAAPALGRGLRQAADAGVQEPRATPMIVGGLGAPQNRRGGARSDGRGKLTRHTGEQT